MRHQKVGVLQRRSKAATQNITEQNTHVGRIQENGCQC